MPSMRLRAASSARTPGQVGRHHRRQAALAAGSISAFSGGCARWFVHHGERMPRAEMPADDFEAADMRRDEDDALPAARAASICSQPLLPDLLQHDFVRTQPHRQQFDDGLAGLADALAQQTVATAPGHA